MVRGACEPLLTPTVNPNHVSAPAGAAVASAAAAAMAIQVVLMIVPSLSRCGGLPAGPEPAGADLPQGACRSTGTAKRLPPSGCFPAERTAGGRNRDTVLQKARAPGRARPSIPRARRGRLSARRAGTYLASP